MTNSFTQIHVHFVFAVKNKQALIYQPIRIRVEKYITGIVQNFGGLRPDQSTSDLTREVKPKSSEFINKEKMTKEKFNWQKDYGAFSYSHSHVQNVIDYVLNQPEHHRKKTFKEEYFEFLKKFEIPYEEKYLFDWIETSPTPTEPHANNHPVSTTKP
jgi:putative transposase